MRSFRRATSDPSPAVVAGRVALLAASGLHLGFQAAVTTVAYPELFEGPRAGLPGRQAEHARRIAPLVAAVYAALAGAAGAAAVASVHDTAGRARTATVVSCAAAALAPVLTGAVTMPLHVEVARGRTSPGRIEGILAADRVRTVAAAVGLVAAVHAVRQ